MPALSQNVLELEAVRYPKVKDPTKSSFRQNWVPSSPINCTNRLFIRNYELSNGFVTSGCEDCKSRNVDFSATAPKFFSRVEKKILKG